MNDSNIQFLNPDDDDEPGVQLYVTQVRVQEACVQNELDGGTGGMAQIKNLFCHRHCPRCLLPFFSTFFRVFWGPFENCLGLFEIFV